MNDDMATSTEDLLQEETTLTEITIQPDGRIYVFGASRPVLEVLESICPPDIRLANLLGHVRAMKKVKETGAQSAATRGGDTSAT